MTAKETILANVRAALKDVPDAETAASVEIKRDYLTTDGLSATARLDLFIERIEDYKVTVKRVEKKTLASQINASLQARDANTIIVPSDLSADWLSANIFTVDDNLTNTELDESDGVLTGCAVAIAQTGSIVLDAGARQGRRAITLLPDYHLCVVFASQLVGTVPEAVRQLEDSVKAGKPVTFISGPSATSDIELERVEGVHGPRTLEVLFVTDG